MIQVDVVIIRGAPGVGKTSAGRLLGDMFSNSAVVDLDRVRAMISAEQFLYGVNENYLIAIHATADLTRSFVRAGKRPVIVTDALCGSFFDAFRQAVYDLNFKSIVLRASPEVLAARLSARRRGFSDWEVACAINDNYNLENCDSGTHINSSLLSKVEVAERIRDAIASSS